jgi:diguanylate cyclase (GGDEF)-like protein
VLANPMPTQPPLYEDFAESDPPTLFASTLGDALPVVQGEWALIRYVGNPIGEVLPLRTVNLTVGRSPENDLCLPEVEISRHHARIELVGQEDMAPVVLISDLGSTNGTYLNGRRILTRNGPVSLQHGDVIRVGTHAFKLKHLDEMEKNYHEAVLAQTTVDSLTGLSNRASVLGFLEKQADLSRRHHRPVALILCDLDHFKEVNDQHGHAVGDQVLRSFGQVALGRLRGSDHVGRIGGEEFLIVLPETEGREALAVAEELRKALAEEPMPSTQPGKVFHVSCCFGVAQLRSEDADAGSLLARADVALYRAKALGRNRVEFDGRT